MGQLILIKGSTESHMVLDTIYSLMQTVWEEPFGALWLTAMVDSPGDTWLNILYFFSCCASVGKYPCLTVFGMIEYVRRIYWVHFPLKIHIIYCASLWEIGGTHFTHFFLIYSLLVSFCICIFFSFSIYQKAHTYAHIYINTWMVIFLFLYVILWLLVIYYYIITPET